MKKKKMLTLDICRKVRSQLDFHRMVPACQRKRLRTIVEHRVLTNSQRIVHASAVQSSSAVYLIGNTGRTLSVTKQYSQIISRI